jgi:Flp pilus assembly protein TadD
VMVKRHEDALAHLKTAERLLPGSQLMWLVKYWQSRALAGMERGAEACAAIHECVSLNPTDGLSYAFEALSAKQIGHDDVARRCIGAAQQLGCDLTQAERFVRRLSPNSPRLEADIAIFRALYASVEPTA